MAPRYRHSLQEKLETHAPAFRMSDVTFKSFQLQVPALLQAPGRALAPPRLAPTPRTLPFISHPFPCILIRPLATSRPAPPPPPACRTA